VKRPHRFFIKRKPNRLNRVEKSPEPWPMPMRAKPCGEHSEGFFFSQQPEIRFWWDSNSGPAESATLPGWASHSAAQPFACGSICSRWQAAIHGSRSSGCVPCCSGCFIYCGYFQSLVGIGLLRSWLEPRSSIITVLPRSSIITNMKIVMIWYVKKIFARIIFM